MCTGTRRSADGFDPAQSVSVFEGAVDLPRTCPYRLPISLQRGLHPPPTAATSVAADVIVGRLFENGLPFTVARVTPACRRRSAPPIAVWRSTALTRFNHQTPRPQPIDK